MEERLSTNLSKAAGFPTRSWACSLKNSDGVFGNMLIRLATSSRTSFGSGAGGIAGRSGWAGAWSLPPSTSMASTWPPSAACCDVMVATPRCAVRLEGPGRWLATLFGASVAPEAAGLGRLIASFPYKKKIVPIRT